MSVRLCVACRVDDHRNCTHTSTDPETGQEVPCPCYTCNPPTAGFCTACKGRINPNTGECRCSD
jgi:hypothetical protein